MHPCLRPTGVSLSAGALLAIGFVTAVQAAPPPPTSPAPSTQTPAPAGRHRHVDAAAADSAGTALPAAKKWVGLREGEWAEFAISLHETTASGDRRDTVTGSATAWVGCLSAAPDGTRRFVMIFRGDKPAASGPAVVGARVPGDSVEQNALRDSVAFIRLDAAGRVLPDLPNAGKVSLDRCAWTATGLVPVLDAAALAAPGRSQATLDLQIYGEAQTLPMTQTLAAAKGGWAFERTPAESSPRLKIGRQSRPLLTGYVDRWRLDPEGRPLTWEHRTGIRYEVPGRPELHIALQMSARVRTAGMLTEAERKALADDAVWLRPVWALLVNPEPDALPTLDVAKVTASLADFLRSRPDSRLAASAKLLSEGTAELGAIAEAAREEAKGAAALMGTAAPDFRLAGSDGGEVTLSSRRGRVVLLVFWGLGCRLCKTEAPHLTDLYRKYRDSGFEVIAVESFDTDPADVRAYLADNKLSHPVALKGSSTGSSLYKIGGLPRAYWIDRQGRIVGRQTGFEGRETLEAKIRELLTEPSGPPAPAVPVKAASTIR